MNQIYRTEFCRVFLLENLPAPLERRDSHWQIFDNYIENTRLRLRSVRVPETKEWTWILQKRVTAEGFAARQIAEIFLDEAEHRAFEIFEGRAISKNEKAQTNEIRKNRYFYDFENRKIEIDLFLGELWGLILGKVNFENASEMQTFEIPPFAVAEVTKNGFFLGENLVGKTFADVQAEFGQTNAQIY